MFLWSERVEARDMCHVVVLNGRVNVGFSYSSRLPANSISSRYFGYSCIYIYIYTLLAYALYVNNVPLYSTLQHPTMSFGGKKFRSKRQQLAYEASLAGRYQKHMNKNPFLWFGLPFCSVIVLGSFWLSEFTAVRYQQKDQKVQEMKEDDLVKMKANQRQFDIKEEYYRLQGLGEQDWEPKRIPRFKGESENVW